MPQKKLNIAVVDDELKCRQDLLNSLDNFFINQIEKHDVVEFSSGEEFLKNFSSNFDIVFLDIEMNEINGMNVAKEIRKKDERVIIIFVTRLISYAVEGYSVNALDYIVKPFDDSLIKEKMNKVLKKLEESQNERSILIKTNYKDKIVKIQDIKFVEVLGHNLLFHLKNEVVSSWGTLNEVINQINSDSFACCNRCYYVNFNYVTGIEGLNLYLDDEIIQISRYKKVEFLNLLTQYLGKKGTIK